MTGPLDGSNGCATPTIHPQEPKASTREDCSESKDEGPIHRPKPVRLAGFGGCHLGLSFCLVWSSSFYLT